VACSRAIHRVLACPDNHAHREINGAPANSRARRRQALQTPTNRRYNEHIVGRSETTIVIVNWNGAAFLPRLLDSVREEQPAKTIVIDNASSDDSLQILKDHTDVIVVPNAENRGYGSAANQGLELCETPYVLLLNVDVKILPRSIVLMEEYLGAHPDVALVAPQLLFEDGRLQLSIRSFPTIRSMALYLSFLDRLVPSGYRQKASEHENIQEIDQPMGAAMMLRKTVLQEVGSFDARFFLYMEEVDLCYRIKQKGYKIVYLPQAQMIHHAGGSSGQDWERAQTQFLHSLFLYFEKNFPDQLRSLRLTLPPALLLRALVLLCFGRFRQSNFYFQHAFSLLIARSSLL